MIKAKHETYVFLMKHLKSQEVVETWLTTPVSVFGGMTAFDFVQELVDIGNAKDYEEAWHEVLGVARKVFG